MNDEIYKPGRILYKRLGYEVHKYTVIGRKKSTNGQYTKQEITLERTDKSRLDVGIPSLDANYSLSKIEILMQIKVELERELERINREYEEFLEEFIQKIDRKKTVWHKKS